MNATGSFVKLPHYIFMAYSPKNTALDLARFVYIVKSQ